jgi:hypothetical protein
LIASFGTDEQENIYVVGYEGMIYKMDFGSADFNEPLGASSAQSSETPRSNKVNEPSKGAINHLQTNS